MAKQRNELANAHAAKKQQLLSGYENLKSRLQTVEKEFIEQKRRIKITEMLKENTQKTIKDKHNKEVNEYKKELGELKKTIDSKNRTINHLEMEKDSLEISLTMARERNISLRSYSDSIDDLKNHYKRRSEEVEEKLQQVEEERKAEVIATLKNKSAPRPPHPRTYKRQRRI